MSNPDETAAAHHSLPELAVANGLPVDHDDELLFLACIPHGLGATDHANTDQRFEVDGADAAARFLEAHDVVGVQRHLLPEGYAERVHTAWPRHDLGYALVDLSGWNDCPVAVREGAS